MPDRTAAERMRRMRQRRAEEEERRQRWGATIAARLETHHPEAARILADLPPDVAGHVVAALNRRQFERAVQRAGSLTRASASLRGAGAQRGALWRSRQPRPRPRPRSCCRWCAGR